MHNAKRYVTTYAEDYTPHVFWANDRAEAKRLAEAKGLPLFLLRHNGDTPGQMHRKLSAVQPWRTYAIFYGGMPIGEMTRMPQHILQEQDVRLLWYARVYVPALGQPGTTLAGAGAFPRMHEAVSAVYLAYSRILLTLEQSKARQAQKPVP